ncbi:lasso peptide biosynthesis B2 protein [Pseudactinotalea sp. HY158]|uniref:lasso peptide biosynthesis B2 protein n=1 Tax=Pseudactinotalea sp. HY158 TaxID=2654547 RepID=UPI00129D1DD0|nr:lasso peptide biosynthesis B2 protein [Pseudactinotalea sp. HY158]QGH68503.1 lasso peptide biosynthesis B2 protein [Pseudactinotalea sp. HY158]
MTPIREVPAVAAALLVACAVEVALHLLSLPRTARAVGAPLRQGGGAAPAARGNARLGPRGRRRVRAVRRVMRHWPFGDTCLRHALVAGQRLRRLHPELVVGVRKTGGVVRAHAWLEFETGLYDPLGVARAYLPLEPLPGEEGT